MNMKVTKDDVGKVLASIQRLVGQEVLVGIPAEKSHREDGEPVNNAQLGYIHEFGSPQANIPARPFLIPGVEAVEDRVAERLKNAATAALAGKKEVVDSELIGVGLTAQAAVRHQITSGDHVELAPRTLAARRKRGRTETDPLVDTGKLRNSINYVIREKE